MKNIDEEIEKLKSEAASTLDRMLKIPTGYSSGASKRIVECIVSAALLEVAMARVGKDTANHLISQLHTGEWHAE